VIVISIKGDKAAVVKAAAAIALMYQTGGKVVRIYKNTTPPDPIPTCEVAIVTSETP
jgi:hypothetical protein